MKKTYWVILLIAVLALAFIASIRLLEFGTNFLGQKVGQKVATETAAAQLKAVTEADYDSLESFSAQQKFTSKLPKILAVSQNNGILEIKSHNKEAVAFTTYHFGQPPIFKTLTEEGHEIIRIDPVDYEKEKRTVLIPTTGTIDILNVANGMGNLSVNLRELSIKEANISVGVGDLEVTASELQNTQLTLANGSGAVTVYLPDSLGYMITLPKNAQLNSANAKLTDEKNNTYTSTNYESAKVKTNIIITGATDFSIRYLKDKKE